MTFGTKFLTRTGTTIKTNMAMLRLETVAIACYESNGLFFYDNPEILWSINLVDR